MQRNLGYDDGFAVQNVYPIGVNSIMGSSMCTVIDHRANEADDHSIAQDVNICFHLVNLMRPIDYLVIKPSRGHIQSLEIAMENTVAYPGLAIARCVLTYTVCPHCFSSQINQSMRLVPIPIPMNTSTVKRLCRPESFTGNHLILQGYESPRWNRRLDTSRAHTVTFDLSRP